MSLPHTFLALLVTMIWGLNFTFIAWALESFPPIMLSSLRFFFMTFPLVFFVKRPTFNTAFIIYAVGTFALQYGFLFFAMRVGASAGLSALILQLQVFFTMILAGIVLKESINRFQILGLVVALVGMLVIGFNLENKQGADINLMGLILLVISAMSWAMGNIASTKLKDIPVLSMLVWSGLIAWLCLMTASLVLETEAWQVSTFVSATPTAWMSLGYIVYMSTFLAFGIWTFLLQKNPASIVVPFAFLVPISGMIASAMLTGEQMQSWKIIALVLILLGLVVSRKKLNE